MQINCGSNKAEREREEERERENLIINFIIIINLIISHCNVYMTNPFTVSCLQLFDLLLFEGICTAAAVLLKKRCDFICGLQHLVGVILFSWQCSL